METSGGDGATETVATREWVIREVDGDGVLVDRVPAGGRARFDRGLFPDDVVRGDRFRVVAQLDRRGRRDGSEPPADDARAAGRDAGDGPFEVPDAMREALRNLT